MEIELRAWDEKQKFMAYQGTPDIETLHSLCWLYEKHKLMMFSGVLDCEQKKIYSDDLIQDAMGTIFRVYLTNGGFVVKDSTWKEDVKDFVPTDILISLPLADAQTQSYIQQSCRVVGNVHEGIFKKF